MPEGVYLVPEVQAWVTRRGGVMGIGSRPVMGLGLGLLRTLETAELRAVLAHEFGHHHGGDTRLGPWIYKTRDALARTRRGLSGVGGILQLPMPALDCVLHHRAHRPTTGHAAAGRALAARPVDGIVLGFAGVPLRAIIGQPHLGEPMTPSLFSSIREARDAFQPEPLDELNPVEQDASRRLRLLRERGGALGYRKDKAPSSSAVKKALAEHGVQLSDDAAARLARYESERAERAMKRSRFWVQVTISLVIVATAILVISLGRPAEATEKALFGLLGTVLGYWLR